MAEIVAFGGGHGLAATLRALRGIGERPVAVVGVSDNGGSSGRLRRDFAVLPPGDLRMALTALCADSDWGQGWGEVLQHRFRGDGELSGHALGNLLITALWQRSDVVSGLQAVAELLQCQGTVLPLALQPLDIVAEVEFDGLLQQVRGQIEVATTAGRVVSVKLEPADAEVTPAALLAVNAADVLVFGPGSWFTSVLTHFALPDMRKAITLSSARRILIANLASQVGETEDLSPADHLLALHRFVPEMRFDAVFVERSLAAAEVQAAASMLGAELIIGEFSQSPDTARHNVVALGLAIKDFLQGVRGERSNI